MLRGGITVPPRPKAKEEERLSVVDAYWVFKGGKISEAGPIKDKMF